MKRSYTKGMPLKDRLAFYSRSSGSCCVWTGARSASGYGLICIDGEMIPSHRAVWELSNGAIPAGLYALHKCDNPPCIKIEHLFIGTNQDNIDDKVAKGRQARGRTLGKLTESDVIAIRNSNVPQAVAAEKYGVAPQTISKIKLRETWKHLP